MESWRHGVMESSWSHRVMQSWSHGAIESIMQSCSHGVMDSSWSHGIMEPWSHRVMNSSWRQPIPSLSALCPTAATFIPRPSPALGPGPRPGLGSMQPPGRLHWSLLSPTSTSSLRHRLGSAAILGCLPASSPPCPAPPAPPCRAARP